MISLSGDWYEAVSALGFIRYQLTQPFQAELSIAAGPFCRPLPSLLHPYGCPDLQGFTPLSFGEGLGVRPWRKRPNRANRLDAPLRPLFDFPLRRDRLYGVAGKKLAVIYTGFHPVLPIFDSYGVGISNALFFSTDIGPLTASLFFSSI